MNVAISIDGISPDTLIIGVRVGVEVSVIDTSELLNDDNSTLMPAVVSNIFSLSVMVDPNTLLLKGNQPYS